LGGNGDTVIVPGEVVEPSRNPQISFNSQTQTTTTSTAVRRMTRLQPSRGPGSDDAFLFYDDVNRVVGLDTALGLNKFEPQYSGSLSRRHYNEYDS
jgi:hypothetical protein